MSEATAERPAEPEIQYATEGSGPVYQRDYWAVFKGIEKTPEEVADALRAHFPEFSPPETAFFRYCNDRCGPLAMGDELEIRIALIGWCRVRVVHVDRRSITLRTLKGHPEAGRITFGAYRDEDDRLAFRIRSRTRQAGLLKFMGYLLFGKQLQSRCWIKFIWRLAESLGGTVDGSVRVRTTRSTLKPADRGPADEPTFSAARPS